MKDPVQTTIKFNKVYFGKGNGDKYRIKINNLNGKQLFEFLIEGRNKIKISEEIKRKKYEKIVFNGGKMPKKMVDQMIKNDPDYAPFYNRFYISDRELIFVFRPNPEKQTIQEFDIFSPKGKYIYYAELKMPDGLIIKSGPVFHNEFVYIFAEDEEGDTRLYKYKTGIPQE